MATVVTNKGKDIAIARIIAGAGLYIAWGTGTGTAAVADTGLATEAAEGRVAATVTQVTTTTANDTLQAVGTLQASANRNITNAGLFDSLTGGNLIMKGDFTAVPLNSGDSIAFTMRLQLT